MQEPIVIALFLVLVVNRLVAGLVTPIFDKYHWDKFWIAYIAWVFGSVLTFAAGINLFTAYGLSPILGRVLSGLVAGGGASLLHDLFDTPALPKG